MRGKGLLLGLMLAAATGLPAAA
ncbi:MAG: hypothetical protein QOE02_2844, partial [Rhodospirillaceae bacterium]|nr:hypothetical protein [Rhodospirillaceae bacterium]